MSRLLNKIESGSSRLFNKVGNNTPKIFNKISGGLNNASGFINKISDIAGNISPLGLAFGPEVSAGLAGLSAIGHGTSHLLKYGSHLSRDAGNSLERNKRMKNENNMVTFS
jgi:hypothetical protein